MSTKINKKNLQKEIKKISWDSFIEEFLSEDDRNNEIKATRENIDESGYWGQGHGSGAESFLGTYFGFGGDMQLATKINPSVARIKKQEQDEMAQNMEDQQETNGGYPARGSSSGMPGGDGLGGPNSGIKYPNNIAQIGKSSEQLDSLYGDDPFKNYWGPPGDVPLDIDLTKESKGDLKEQGPPMGGPQRGAASDQNYRDLPGNNRPNKLEKPIRFLPKVEGDKDHDGEEDEYLENDEYVNDVLRLNGINEPTNKVMKNLGIQNNVASESHLSIKRIFFEDWYDAPKTGTERYKQGRNLDTAEISMDPTKAIMGYKDHSQGHAGDDPAETSPGGTAYGVVIAPKGFVPEDWEQRSDMTKEDDFDKTQLTNEQVVQNFIDKMVKEEFVAYLKESYTGIEDDTGNGKSEGASAAFQKNKKEVLAADAKEKKNLTAKTRK